jgi:3-deoxy-7-phosphoheptulonate synthase/chorismate mutase
MTVRGKSRIDDLREQIDGVNEKVLQLLNRRTQLVEQVRDQKLKFGLPMYDPMRERDQMARLLAHNPGPMSRTTVENIFREVFRASLAQMQLGAEEKLQVKMREMAPRGVDVSGIPIGAGKPIIIAGPCAVEQKRTLDVAARRLKALGVQFLRGGGFKPRTSPYAFQGLGMRGVEILAEVASRHGMRSVSEATDVTSLARFVELVDVVQVGARNMFNYDLLKRLGEIRRPVLLKRSFGATTEEMFLAAEYLMSGGNRNVVLCERGIRTFETATRNTLDLSSVCLVKETTDLPIIVDVSHAAGRRDLLLRLSRAALAAGADGLMVEVHPAPGAALSDGSQQLGLDEFARFMEGLQPYLEQRG